MCAPVLPLLTTLAAVGSAAASLGVFGSKRVPTPKVTPPPATKGPGPAAQAAGDDVRTKKVDESVKIQQNAKQKRDKQTVKKGLGALGAAPAINTGVDSTPAGGINTGT
tara:strand:- start:542 stop:868 length:327 start_codon:yes stop_codon:yes gene_type:complete